MEVLIIVFCTIGGVIIFSIVVACACSRTKARRGMVVDATGGSNALFCATPRVIHNGVGASYPQQMQVQPTSVLPYQAVTPPSVGQAYPTHAYPSHLATDAGPPPPYTESPHHNGGNLRQMDDYTPLDPSLRGRGSVQQHSNGQSQSRQTSSSTQYSSYETPYRPWSSRPGDEYLEATRHHAPSNGNRTNISSGENVYDYIPG